MTVPTRDRVTLGGVLFANDDAAQALRGELHKVPPTGAAGAALQALGMGIRDAALQGVADQVARVLDLDVIEVVMAGWRRYEALVAAGRRTLAALGAEEIVELAEHRITSSHRPRIDVIVDEAKVAEINLKIEATVDLHTVSAVVFAGRLMALRSGRASIEVSLEIGGLHVASARRDVDLSIELPLGSGMPLADAPEFVQVPAGQAAVPVT